VNIRGFLAEKMTTLLRLALVYAITMLGVIREGSAITFEEYQRDHDTTDASDIIIGGPHFVLNSLIHEITSFDVSQDLGDRNHSIRVFPLTIAQALCRMQGYFEHCKHPFVEHGGNESNHDDLVPFRVDYIITNEIIDPGPGVPEDLQHFPMFVSGVVPVFNIPGIKTLYLDKVTLARIFRQCSDSDPHCLPGSISRWNDSTIKATNPPTTHAILDAAGQIKLVLRKDNVDSTNVLKESLGKFEPAFAAQVGANFTPSGWELSPPR